MSQDLAAWLMWGAVIAVIAGLGLWDARRELGDIARLARRRRYLAAKVAEVSERQEQPGIGWLVVRPHTQHVARVTATDEHQRCDRCRTGVLNLPCACRTDCYAPQCLGWWDDWRDALRGDAQ